MERDTDNPAPKGDDANKIYSLPCIVTELFIIIEPLQRVPLSLKFNFFKGMHLHEAKLYFYFSKTIYTLSNLCVEN